MPDAQSTPDVLDIRISGDGSKVFLLGREYIQAWSIQTRDVVAELRFGKETLYCSLVIDGSRVWFFLKDLQIQGWDFGISDSSPIPLSNISPDKPHFCFIGTEGQNISPSRVEDTVTRKTIFQLFGRYAKPSVAQWNGQYLVAGYESGEVLILDFSHLIIQ